MRSTRQAEPQKKNRLGLPECLLSCFIKRSLAQLFFFAHHSLRCGESVCHAHHSKTGELRSLLAAVTARMDKTSGRRTGVSDGRRDGDVDGQCRGTWEVVAVTKPPGKWSVLTLGSGRSVQQVVALRGLRGEAAARTARRRLRFSVVREIPLCDGPLASPSLRCASRLPGVNFSRMPLCVAVVRCEECEASRAGKFLQFSHLFRACLPTASTAVNS